MRELIIECPLCNRSITITGIAYDMNKIYIKGLCAPCGREIKPVELTYERMICTAIKVLREKEGGNGEVKN